MKLPFRFNLQARYSVQILLVILGGMIGLSLLSVTQFRSMATGVENTTSSAIESHLQDQVRERGVVMGQFLARELTNPLLNLDFRRMLEHLGNAVSQRDVVFAYVYGPDGTIVHDGSPAIVAYGRSLDETLGWPASAARAPRAENAGEVLHITRPIILADTYLGGVAIGLSLDVVAAESAGLRRDLNELTAESLRQELLYAGIFTVLFLLAGTLLALVTGRRLARPIRTLADQARQLGEGNFDRDISVSRRDEIGDLANAFSTMRSKLLASQQKAEYLAFHDVLTGLRNRASLVETLDELCIRNRSERKLGAVLFIDLDDFKPVNDTLGHEAGDDLLVEAAARLKHCLTGAAAADCLLEGSVDASVARLGGDEFTIVLTRLPEKAQAERVADEVLAALSQAFEIKGNEVFIGASIGISLFPDHGRDAEALLASADVAMYHAKRRGKHAWRRFEQFMLDETRERMFLINELRRALESDGLTVHYQPIIAAANARVIGAEALVRWEHPERGLIKAADFIEAAEKGGEMERLGFWVIKRVCRDLSRWRDQGLEGLFVSINISSDQLLRPDLPDLVTGMLTQYGLGPRDLRVEASEQRFAGGSTDRATILRRWNDQGFDLWIDHFGSGSASLMSLRDVPARGIKLDPQFLKGMSTNERQRDFVAAIMQMASTMKLEVCAVGVTTAPEASWLADHGCRYLQGQFLGPELSADELPRHLEFTPMQQGGYQTAKRKTG